MIAILALIKTFIPFVVGFLFLWGIGRMCCSNAATKKKTQQANRAEETAKTDEDERTKQQKLKAELKQKARKRANNKKRTEIFVDRKELSTGKRDMISAREQDLIHSREGLMEHKSDLFSSKPMLINKGTERPAKLDLILSLPTGKQRKRTSLQRAFLLKEMLDAPKAIKPYRSRYPR